MRLILTRSQRAGGMFGGSNVFVLDAKAEVTEHERTLLQKYGLMGQVLYSSTAARKHIEAGSQAVATGGLVGLAKGLGRLAIAKLNLNVTIKNLLDGVHVESKDLEESLGAEGAIIEGAQNLQTYIRAALTYDGRPRIYVLNEETGEFEPEMP